MIVPTVIALGSVPRTRMMSPTFNVGTMLSDETTMRGDSVRSTILRTSTLPYVAANRTRTSRITLAAGFFLKNLTAPDIVSVGNMIAAENIVSIDIAFELWRLGISCLSLNDPRQFEGGSFACLKEVYSTFSDLVDSASASFF